MLRTYLDNSLRGECWELTMVLKEILSLWILTTHTYGEFYNDAVGKNTSYTS